MKKILRNYKIITVYCKCGFKLLKYRKGGGGRLRKIHPDRIAKRYTDIFDHKHPVGTPIFCPNCQKRIATVAKVSGKYVNKVNQGQLGLIRK